MLAEKQAQPSAEPEVTLPVTPRRPLCPKCQQPALVMMDGCMTCTNCGDSKSTEGHPRMSTPPIKTPTHIAIDEGRFDADRKLSGMERDAFNRGAK